MQETWVQSLDGEDFLENGMATHSSILAWRIPQTEEPGGLQSMGLQESDMTERLTSAQSGLLSRRERIRFKDSLLKYFQQAHVKFSASLWSDCQESSQGERKQTNYFEASHLGKSTKVFKNLKLAKKEYLCFFFFF